MFKKLFSVLALFLLSSGVAGADFFEDALKEEAEDVLQPVVRDIGLGISAGMNTKAGPLSFPSGEVALKTGIISVSDDNDIIDTSYLPIPLLSLEAGLPKNIDIYGRGMAISLGGDTITLIGGGIRYSFLEDKLLSPLPAVSATAGINRLSVDDITITATTIGVSASKKFLFITPYVGVSYEILAGEFKTDEAGTLKPDEDLFRFNIGAELSPFPALYLQGGADINGDSDSPASYYAALGARFSI